MSRSTQPTVYSLELAREISRRLWEESGLPGWRKSQRTSEAIPMTNINNLWLFWDQFDPHMQSTFLERTIFLAAAGIAGGWELNAWCATQFARTIESLNELESLRLRQQGKLELKEQAHAHV